MPDTPRRFFVPPGTVRARHITLGPPLAHRLGRVLRLRRGDHVILAEGGPQEYEVQLTGVSGHAVTALVVAEREAPPEPGVNITLYQSLIRANRFDLVLEKGTEIGVARFVPMIAARSQVQADGEPAPARAERWQRLIIEAAEQCGRGRLPAVEAPRAFEQAVSAAPGVKLLPYEEEEGLGLSAYLNLLPLAPEEVSLFIGPEGGFEEAEVAFAREQGAAVVTLGSRIMRAETAAIVAVALVLNACGDLG
jgi:16S rRNA (uracil1498-N3)-methyltransferase